MRIESTESIPHLFIPERTEKPKRGYIGSLLFLFIMLASQAVIRVIGAGMESLPYILML